jgi:hypothetical protein
MNYKLILTSVVLMCATLVTSSSSNAQSADTETTECTVTGIYFFGCNGSHVDEVKAAIPIHIGDKLDMNNSKQIKNKFWNAVWQTTRCSPTDVALIMNGNRELTIYVGLPGRDVAEAKDNAVGTEPLVVPEEGTKLYDDMMKTLSHVLATRGPVAEDDSNGYSLTKDDLLRPKELAFREWALTHQDVIFKVLKESSVKQQREVAAYAVGYLDPSKTQIDALVSAVTDRSGAVRNNAIRSLACIASSSKARAAMIPPEPFLQLLNSGEWTDRNKGEFVIKSLCANDPSLYEKLKTSCLQSLCEMACWDRPHASGARALLSHITNIAPEKINEFGSAGDLDSLTRVVFASDASRHEQLPPSLVDLGIILRDVFKADQSDNARTYAPEGYAKLFASRDLFKGTKLEGALYDSLAFESFHMGQSQAHDKKDADTAIDNFNKCVQWSEQAHALWEKRGEAGAAKYSEEWTSYAKATIAYLRNDKVTLHDLYGKCGSNDRIVALLMKGLDKGNVDYSRDY